jgi:para-aminobenzoate synthetase component 2
MILLIDNYDSFTWNLYQYFCELGAEVLVRRNDELTLADIIALAPAKIVISPGPCTPDESGISLAAIRHFSGQTPILGVCLGHQAIAQVFGAAIVRAAKVMHGKTSPVSHTGQGVFLGLNNPLTVTRYHSLLIDPLTLPECFEVTARSEEGRSWAFATACSISRACSFIRRVFSASRATSCWQTSSIGDL